MFDECRLEEIRAKACTAKGCDSSTHADEHFLLAMVDALQVELLTMDGCWKLVMKDREELTNERDALRAELEEARAPLESYKKWFNEATEPLQAELSRLTEENRKLREALGHLLDNIGTSVPPDRPSIQMVQRARAALSTGDKP